MTDAEMGYTWWMKKRPFEDNMKGRRWKVGRIDLLAINPELLLLYINI